MCMVKKEHVYHAQDMPPLRPCYLGITPRADASERALYEYPFSLSPAYIARDPLPFPHAPDVHANVDTFTSSSQDR
jgi:hypothetical protein